MTQTADLKLNLSNFREITAALPNRTPKAILMHCFQALGYQRQDTLWWITNPQGHVAIWWMTSHSPKAMNRFFEGDIERLALASVKRLAAFNPLELPEQRSVEILNGIALEIECVCEKLLLDLLGPDCGVAVCHNSALRYAQELLGNYHNNLWFRINLGLGH